MASKRKRQALHALNGNSQQPQDIKNILDIKAENGSTNHESSQTTPQSNRRARKRDTSLSPTSLNWQRQPSVKLNGYSNHLSDYHNGAIVKIAMKNFVTYDSCEFYPGPYLNMVIGPNGTGKSTVVCALALGLGGNPSLLGRAKDISEFVKHGHETAWVELTLKGSSSHQREVSDDSQNNAVTTIRRSINRSSNKSTWKLNGKSVSLSEIHATTERFRVQVDNLCQFLPQDRVVEFSKMSSQKLLIETQRAVGRSDLADLQSKLIEYREKEKQILGQIKAAMEDETALTKQNEVIERDVQRWQEREQAENRVRALKLQIPLARYAAAKQGYEEAKQRRREAHSRYVQLQKEAGPATQDIEETKANIERLEMGQREAKADQRSCDRKLRNVLGQLERQERSVQELNDEIKSLKDREKRKKQEIIEVQQELMDLESRAGEAPDPSQRQEIQAQLDELFDREQAFRSQIQELQEQQQDIQRDGRQYQEEIRLHTNGLKRLDDVKNRKMKLLYQFSRDAAEAVNWLEQNRAMFKKHVFTPVCMQVNVNDNVYSPIIESLIKAGTHKTFVCQCEEDYLKLTREVNDRMRLRINVVAIPESKRVENYRPPITSDELRRYGFDGYALDMIEAPPPVLAYLCDAEKLHAIPISLNEVNNEAVEKLGIFGSYVASGTQYIVSRARYGARNISVLTSKVRQQAKLLSSGETTELLQERNKLIQNIEECRTKQQENENKIRELSKKEQQINNERRETIEPERQRLHQEKEVIRRKMQEYERSMIKIESTRKKLQILKQSQKSGGENSIADRKAEIQSNLKNNAVMRGDLVKQLAKHLSKAVDSTMGEMTNFALAIAELKQKLNRLEEQESLYRTQLAEALYDVNETKRQCDEEKARASELLREARAITDTITDEDRELMQSTINSDMDIDELESQLAAAQQRLELTTVSGLTAQVVDDYRKRKKELKSMRKKVKDLRSKWQKIVQEKIQTRQEWEVPLEELVQKINVEFKKSFESIGCQGEVQLAKVGGPSESLPPLVSSNAGTTAAAATQRSQPTLPEDQDEEEQVTGQSMTSFANLSNEEYHEWGISISVSFRATEKMQVLTSHRQSGGERAVSTVLYLQSLQALTAAPFRVVDEINQGMDQRNERMIHRRIIETVCKAAESDEERMDMNGTLSSQAFESPTQMTNGSNGRSSNTSQYFLITPKLLPNLEYHCRMKVLCIYNGEWQPEKFNLAQYIKNANKGRK